jgi:preprotein translocase subunit SecF
MEFFSRTYTVDWMSKAKYFFALSAILMLIGGTAWYRAGSLPYGIDFKGGTLVYVRFAGPPPVDQLRSALAARGLGESSIQEIRDLTRPNANEVVIALELRGDQEQALDAGKTLIIETLRSTFSASDSGKPDFNSATADVVTEILTRRDPLTLGLAGAERYKALGRALIDFRDKQRSGLVPDAAELKQVAGMNDPAVAALRDAMVFSQYAVRDAEMVGPRVGAQLRRQAIFATLYALAGMLVYIAFRFEWTYGAASVLAVLHDVLITLGFFSLFKFEISLTVIAALLTLVGYSMNDKIVIFDRVRENLRLHRREPLRDIVNLSINQTLSRTFLTGGMTFVGLVVLFLMGGNVLRGFAFALVAGIVIGTYSSFGIAAPLIVLWHRWRGAPVAAGGPSSGSRAPVNESSSRLAAAGKR